MAKVYCFKNIKFYQPEVYERFNEMCKNSSTSVTREINAAINKYVEAGKLPSQEKCNA